MLSFEKTGTVASVNVDVGTKVYSGTVLATLSSEDLYASLLQAKAQLANQQAILEQLEVGPRPEELAVKMQAVENAKSTLEVTYSGIPDSIRDADSKTSDAIKSKLSTLFTLDGSGYKLSISGCNQQFSGLIEAKRGLFEKTLSSFQVSTASISSLSDKVTLDTGLDNAYITTREATALLDDLSSLLSSNCLAGNSSVDTYRTIVSTARTTVGTVFTDISTKRAALNTAKNTLSSATRDLDLLKAGTDKAKIRAQAALVAQAEAQVASAQAAMSKSALVAPFNGIITKVDITKGETASAGKSAITLISSSAFQVEAKIPEVDISKISVGNSVKVTLDAYGDGVPFDAVVSRVDPSATMEGNVPVYRAIVSFKEIDSRIKSGMTANVSIVTSSKEKTLSLPIRFVTVETDGSGLVQVVSGKEKKTVRVTLGIRGDDGTIEIVSGLLPTDKVVAIQPGVRAAQKQTQ
jgi:HlyD family secretion protein